MRALIPFTLAAAMALASLPAASQSPPGATTDNPPRERGVEAYAAHHRLDGGFSDWNEVGARGWLRTGAHLWNAELASMRRFGERGAYAAVGDTYTFHPDWYGSLTLGAGDGASYLPEVRTDAFLNRKLLPARNLVASAGLGYYRAPDGHRDHSLSLGAMYYFEQPLVLQGELRFNHSDPGGVNTRRQLVAATWGVAGQTLLVLRHGWGEEGYQSLGAGATLVNFRSHETGVVVRHWFGRSWGAAFSLDRYSNPAYRRDGLTVALFLELP